MAVLALKNARIHAIMTASGSFVTSNQAWATRLGKPLRGLINAIDAPYAGVVSAGGPSTNLITCANASLAVAGIYAFNSSKFIVDGITIDRCGNTTSAAVILCGPPVSPNMNWPAAAISATGNSSVIQNSVVSSSVGHGVATVQCVRCVVNKNTIKWSGGAGVAVLGLSGKVIVSDNVVTDSANAGVLCQDSTKTVICGNSLTSNAIGIQMINFLTGSNQFSTQNTILNNTMANSRQQSILFSANISGFIQNSVICGNTFQGNNGGISVQPVYKSSGYISKAASGAYVSSSVPGWYLDGVLNVTYFGNRNYDVANYGGISPSFLTNGFNYIFDPMDRLRQVVVEKSTSTKNNYPCVIFLELQRCRPQP